MGFLNDFNPLSSARFGSPFYGLGKKGQTNIFDPKSGKPANTAPTDQRNFQDEIAGITAEIPAVAGAYFGVQQQYDPQLTGLNLSQYRNAVLGQRSFDSNAYLADNQRLQQSWDSDPGYKDVYGTLQNYAYQDYLGNSNDPRYMPYDNSGTAGIMRQSFNAANPELTSYTQGLGGVLSQLNSQMPQGYTASLAGAPQGYNAALTGAPTATYTAARGLAANGGPLLNGLNRTAAASMNSISPIQLQLQRQAMNLVGTNGGLSAGELANVQDSVRSAYASRGLLRSNAGIGAEILQTDQAQRQRLMENAQFAQGIDASGQQQLLQNRNFALGVQGQGQGLSQFNAGLLTNTNTYNAGQANQLGMYNAGMLQQAGMYNAGALNAASQFNAQLGQQNAQYNAGALNTASQFNAGLLQQNLNDAWNRSMGYGNLQLAQAQNPNALAMAVSGQAPDYTNSLMGYSSDLYNTNFNANAAANIAAGNNSAAQNSAMIGGGAAIGGALIIAL